MGSSEVDSVEVNIAEIRKHITMLIPPLIPNIYPLLENSKMFLICQDVSPLSVLCIERRSFIDKNNFVDVFSLAAATIHVTGA